MGMSSLVGVKLLTHLELTACARSRASRCSAASALPFRSSSWMLASSISAVF
jgi:hypothetical protein